MEKLMDMKLRIEKGQLIDEIKSKELLILTDELNKLSKEFIVNYLIDKLTPEVTVYNSKSMFKSLPPPISPKEIRILSLYDAGDYDISQIEGMNNRGYDLNPIQIYILNHKKIYKETLKIDSDPIIHNTNKVLNDMGFPECLYDITKVRQNVLLKQYNIIQAYKTFGSEKVNATEEVANRREANDNLRQTNLANEAERLAREENQTREDGRNLIERIRKEEEAAKAKRDLEELERKKFLSSPQPQPQIKSQEELAEAERIRAEAERKRLNDDILRQEKHERDVAQGLVSSGPDSFLGPSLGNNSGDSFYTRENNKNNANTNALLNALNPPITKEELSNFILIVCDQIDKQIGIFIFWMELVKQLFDSEDKRGNIQIVQIDTINKYRAYRASITTLHTENLSTLDEYKIRIACIIHEQQFKILDNAMKLTINWKRFILTKDELTHMQQCIAILLCLTPHAFFIRKVQMNENYTNEMSQELNKELVQYEWSKNHDTGYPVYLYGATVRFDTYTDSERPWYISEQTKFIFGVKKCDRAIEDTGTFTNNSRGFANIKKLMEDLGLGQNRTPTSSYFFLNFPAENLLQETLSELQKVLNRASPTEKVLPFLEFFSLNKELTGSDDPKESLQLVQKKDGNRDLITSPILKIIPRYTKALLVYIRDERSKCSYIGTYRLTGKKPKGGRKTRRQRRTKQRKHKVKGQKKTQKQRRKKTQKRRSNK